MTRVDKWPQSEHQLINGNLINGQMINGAGTLGDKVRTAIELATDIPMSARKEFEEFLDSLPEHILDSAEQLLNLDLPEHLLSYIDIFIGIVRVCAGA